MGRPLNKKFFGNRNIGSTGTGDNYGIGGEGLLSFTLPGQLGSIEVDSDSGQPTLTIPSPQLPSGVAATATVTWEVATITISATNDYGTGYTNGETVTLTGASGVTATIVVAADDITTITPVTRGSFTTIPTSESYQVVGVTSLANDAQAEITWRVKSIVVLEKGSGYTSAPTLSWAAGSAGPISGTSPGVPTVSLTTDSGYVGSSTNQENAIQITAWVPATGTAGNISGNGTSAVTGDILRQTGSKKYVVRTAQGVGRVTLVAAVPAVGEATIIATDANGNTYYVTKLTAHKAKLTRLVDDGGDLDWIFATGDVAQWSFEAASGLVVQIANA